MGLFSNLDQGSEVKIEVEEETLGGGGKWVKETGVYDFIVKMAYGGQSKGGAYFIKMELETEDGKAMEVTEYITSGESKGTRPYYICKTTGKNKPLPGYSKMNAVDVILTGNAGQFPETVEKEIPIWNKEAEKKVPTKSQVVNGWIGQPITALVRCVREFKQAQNPTTKKWENTTETRDVAEVIHFVDAVTGQTRSEKMAGKDAVVKPQFESKYDSAFVYDKTKGAKSKSTTPAASKAPAVSPFDSK